MSLAQDLRAVYYARGNDELERLLEKVDAMEARDKANRNPVPIPPMPMRHYREDMHVAARWACLECGTRHAPLAPCPR